ncbi:MAG: UDP-N-acetylmuramate--L-alanine ligase [Lachnospiraceae bacterium]|nr:UDP-N-acetylmuramate--L-alanine ligase [Lachnospiraceae bacterium]
MSFCGSAHVHFMGICGSGCASIAMIAARAGYKVTGCDQSTDSYYAKELKKLGIEIHEGHNREHLTEDVDFVAVSPALFDISPDEPELLLAKERGILMTWQEFMGKYLQKDKKVIAVSGTHGKTTTTFMTAELLIGGKLDPTVEGGSVYKKWGNGGRYGEGEIFLCEADEFNRNFLNYHPEIAAVNNAEMDHPECFRDFDDMIDAYVSFLTGSRNLKTVILNADSEGAMEVLGKALDEPRVQAARKILYTRDRERTSDDTKTEIVFYESTEKTKDGTAFRFTDRDGVHEFRMKLYGEYNVSNAVTASLIARAAGLSDEVIAESLLSFSGVGRRFDYVGDFSGIPVFDDYAHHPTEIKSVLTMCREYFGDRKVTAVFEPHQVSRLTLMFDRYVDALNIADHVIIMKTHLGREIHKGVRPIPEETWKAASPKMLYEEEYESIRGALLKLIEQDECGIIVVIGAANSYRISQALAAEGKTANGK